SRTRYERSDDWLYPNYALHTEHVGGKRLALKRFAALLDDLLVTQLQLSAVQHTDDMYGSRFHGIRLRTAMDDDAKNVTPLLIDPAMALLNPASMTDMTDEKISMTPETHANDGYDTYDTSFHISPEEKNKMPKNPAPDAFFISPKERISDDDLSY